MSALALPGRPRLIFPRRSLRRLLSLDAFDFRRILRPLRIIEEQFHPYQPIQFLDAQMGAWPPQGGTVTGTFRNSYSINSTTATYNFTTVNLGTEAADRIIALVIHPRRKHKRKHKFSDHWRGRRHGSRACATCRLWRPKRGRLGSRSHGNDGRYGQRSDGGYEISLRDWCLGGLWRGRRCHGQR
jgi:hypothetical protein